MNDAKLMPSETVATQHKPQVVTLNVTRWKKKDLCSTETKIRYDKLRGAKAEEFRKVVFQQIPTSSKSEWNRFRTIMVKAVKGVYGMGR